MRNVEIQTMKLHHLLLISLCSGIAGCIETGTPAKTPSPGDVLGAHVDTTVHPGNDFFAYANGGWVKKNPIPDAENGWGIFNLVEDENLARLRKISEDATTRQSAAGSPGQQIGDFFAVAMDSALADRLALEPVADLLKAVDSLKDRKALTALIHRLQEEGVGPAYGLYVGQDMKNSEKNMIYLSQGGLGLPDRDYYFNQDTRTKEVRAEYLNHVRRTLMLNGSDSASAGKQAADVLKLETALAASHRKLEDLRDPYANYHKMSVSQAAALAPALAFSSALELWKVKADSVIVGQPEFLKNLNRKLESEPLDAWKAYLRWHILSSFSPYLNSAADREHFTFYNQVLRGTKAQRPRWKRVLAAQEEALGDALGQLFVKEYFPAKTKKRYEDLVEHIVESYREHIRQLDWMSDSTKEKALKKLNAITRKVGYPEKWKDYSAMRISRSSFAANMRAANRWHFRYQADKLAKPVDRSEWGMTPQTYNAYYNPSNNEIVLPAAIFTAPGYRDEEIDDAVVYGYVGASTIGHELTHGFDDEGRQFDEKGNLRNWWSKEDEARFKEKAERLVEQFNQFVVLDSLHPNGRATLGENIADLGGIVIGLDAFRKTEQFKQGKRIAGLTPLQRYFMGYAYGWMQVKRPEALANQLLTDVHAPIFLRVNGPMSNCDAWYEAFGVTPEHKMYRQPADRVKIW